MAIKPKDKTFIGSVICIIFLVAVVYVAYDKITEAKYSRDAMMKKQEETQRQKRELAEEVDYLNKYIDRLLKDSEFFKMEVRRRLGTVEQGEVVIREEGAENSGPPPKGK